MQIVQIAQRPIHSEMSLWQGSRGEQTHSIPVLTDRTDEISVEVI